MPESTPGQANRFEIYLNGAFFLGAALDGDRLAMEGMEKAQRQLHGQLEKVAEGKWEPGIVADGDGRWFTADNVYASVVPLAFMSCRGDCHAEVLQRVVSAETMPGWAWTLEDATVDFHESGAGVLALTASVTVPFTTTVGESRAGVERMVNRLVEPCNELIQETVADFLAACRTVIPAYVMDVAWCQDTGAQQGSPDTDAVQHTASKSLLWLHSTYIFEDADVDFCSTEQYQVLLPSIFENLQMRNLIFLPGIGSSVVVHGKSKSKDLVGIDMLLKLMNLQWAHIAIIMEADRTLFRRLNTFAATGRTASATRLESEARAVLNLYDRTRIYRSALDTVLIDLGRGAKEVWDAMARVQGLPEVLCSVRDKLDALQTACQGQLERASIQRQRRLGVAVDVFTVFSVVASVAAVGTFLLDTQLAASVLPRMVTLGATLMLIVAVMSVARAGGRRR